MPSLSTHKKSLFTLVLISAFMLTVAFCYYPKWTKSGTEATISWDVSGYYMYLPAVFIYHDLRECSFHDEILREYGPTPDFQQAFRHHSGHYVMKYPCGQALQFLPLFAMAHLYAISSDHYAADGFSRPYQLSVALTSLIFMLIGMWYLRLILIVYFSDTVTSWTLVGIALGSNYFDYSVITGSMTHNHLFAWYAILIYLTIQFYKSPNILRALLIGTVIGIASLTRPTETISCLIPLCWGMALSKKGVLDRLAFAKSHWTQLLSAVIICLLIGCIQLVYWKYATGDWIVYSYEEQGFSWLKPHLWDGLFSYRSGWLVYSPLMALSVIGLYVVLRAKAAYTTAVLLFSGLFIYIAFAWDIWWYGGALGQRAMVQAYPVLAFPFAACVERLHRGRWGYYLSLLLFIGGIYINLWFTHQAHLGGMLKAGHMTKAYFWKTLGRYQQDPQAIKLLDTTDEFTGERQQVELIYELDFDDTQRIIAQDGTTSEEGVLRLDADTQYSPKWKVGLSPSNQSWIRASVDASQKDQEGDIWRMTQFIISFLKDGEEQKTRMIRLQRLMHGPDLTTVFFDTEIPDDGADQLIIYFWNSNSTKSIALDNLRIEAFHD